MRRHLGAVGLPTTPGAIRAGGFATGALLAAMAHDKKAKAGQPRFVLTRGIGRAFAGVEVDPAQLEALFEAAA